MTGSTAAMAAAALARQGCRFVSDKASINHLPNPSTRSALLRIRNPFISIYLSASVPVPFLQYQDLPSYVHRVNLCPVHPHHSTRFLHLLLVAIPSGDPYLYTLPLSRCRLLHQHFQGGFRSGSKVITTIKLGVGA